VGQAADWVMEAIRRKATRASSDVALVVDGVEAPFLAILTDLSVSADFQGELDGQAWHSIWVVGLSGARKLAGRALP
jgi:hypothetical protein